MRALSFTLQVAKDGVQTVVSEMAVGEDKKMEEEAKFAIATMQKANKQQAKEAQTAGEAAFATGAFSQAIDHFTAALELTPADASDRQEVQEGLDYARQMMLLQNRTQSKRWSEMADRRKCMMARDRSELASPCRTDDKASDGSGSDGDTSGTDESGTEDDAGRAEAPSTGQEGLSFESWLSECGLLDACRPSLPAFRTGVPTTDCHRTFTTAESPLPFCAASCSSGRC